ncbi:MAG: CaiB/BaiF CoA transferase family protein [Acidimicrobiales bacterium]
MAGLLVADFSRVLAGPLATMFLGDLGASVVKVERPQVGDDTRRWGPPFVGDEAAYYLSVNRNKRSVELDFGDEVDRRRAFSLAAAADVVVENFRPGTLERFGLGYGDVSAANPGVVYCTISGFGAAAGAGIAGYDLVAQAMGGLMSVTGPAGGPPFKAGVAVADILTGLHAAVGIEAALVERRSSGLGQRVEVDLLSSVLSSTQNLAAGFLNGGVVPAAVGNAHPSIVPYEALATADRPLVVAVGNDAQFAALCGVLGCPELAGDRRFATNADRVEHRRALVGLLEERLSTRTADDWVERLRSAEVACGPVNALDAAFADAESFGLAPSVEQRRPGLPAVRTVANPVRLARTPVTYRRPPPALGADNAELFDWLDRLGGA